MTSASGSSSGRNSPASLLLRSKSAPAKIQTIDLDESLQNASKQNFISRTIFAPILFLSFIFSLAIVDRKRALEEDRQLGHLTKRRRLLYFGLYWKIPRAPTSTDHTEPVDGDVSETRSRSGSEGSDPNEKGAPDVQTLAQKQKEARSLSAEAFSIQNRVMVAMGIFSIAFGLACWVTYLKVKEFMGFA